MAFDMRQFLRDFNVPDSQFGPQTEVEAYIARHPQGEQQGAAIIADFLGGAPEGWMGDYGVMSQTPAQVQQEQERQGNLEMLRLQTENQAGAMPRLLELLGNPPQPSAETEQEANDFYQQGMDQAEAAGDPFGRHRALEQRYPPAIRDAVLEGDSHDELRRFQAHSAAARGGRTSFPIGPGADTVPNAEAVMAAADTGPRYGRSGPGTAQPWQPGLVVGIDGSGPVGDRERFEAEQQAARDAKFAAYDRANPTNRGYEEVLDNLVADEYKKGGTARQRLIDRQTQTPEEARLARSDVLAKRRESLRISRLKPGLRLREMMKEENQRQGEMFERKLTAEQEAQLAAIAGQVAASIAGQGGTLQQIQKGMAAVLDGKRSEADESLKTETPDTVGDEADVAGMTSVEYLSQDIGDKPFGDYLRFHMNDSKGKGMAYLKKNAKSLRNYMIKKRGGDWARWEAGDPNVWVNRSGLARKNFLNLNRMRRILDLPALTETQYSERLDWTNRGRGPVTE